VATITWLAASLPLFQAVSVSVSVLTLTAISLERCYAICYPLKFKPTTKMSRLVIVLVWFLAMNLCIPELVVLDVHPYLPEHLPTNLLATCKPTWPDESQMAFQLFLIIALFFLPFCIMGVAYIKIAVVLWSNYIPTEMSSK
jgi:hypocretin (orexin) receptor 2